MYDRLSEAHTARPPNEAPSQSTGLLPFREADVTWSSHADTDGPVHVWPDDDQLDHDLDSFDCICGPKVDFGPGYEVPVVTHHSLDGRERNERG